MKKLLVISNYDISDTGMSGGTRILIEMLKEWKNLIDVSVFADERFLNVIKNYGLDNIRTKIITPKREHNKDILSNPLRLLVHMIIRTFQALSFINKNIKSITRYDYIYSPSDFYPDLIPAYYIKLRNRNIKWICGYFLLAPFPFSRFSPYKGSNIGRGIFYYLMQKLSLLLARSKSDYVLVTSSPDIVKFKTNRLTGKNIITVQGGVDISESVKYLSSSEIIPVDKRKFKACFVGRFHFQKGTLELIRIWKIVTESIPGAMLAIIGEGPMEKEMRRLINELNLNDNIIFFGFMDGSKKYDIFKQSMVILHPATYDSGGMAAAEGMAWGLPGVSFNLEALKTYYPKGMLKAPPGNIEYFAELVIRLLNDRELYKKTSVEAISLIQDVWDWKKRANFVYNSIFGAN